MNKRQNNKQNKHYNTDKSSKERTIIIKHNIEINRNHKERTVSENK